MFVLGFLVFGIVAHRPGPGHIVFGLASRLPPGAYGFAMHPFALISADELRKHLKNPHLDDWLRRSWLEEWYHAYNQQRPSGPFFYILYGIEWLIDKARNRQPYQDSSLEADAKRWVNRVMNGLEPTPEWLEPLVEWSKNAANR